MQLQMQKIFYQVPGISIFYRGVLVGAMVPPLFYVTYICLSLVRKKKMAGAVCTSTPPPGLYFRGALASLFHFCAGPIENLQKT